MALKVETRQPGRRQPLSSYRRWFLIARGPGPILSWPGERPSGRTDHRPRGASDSSTYRLVHGPPDSRISQIHPAGPAYRPPLGRPSGHGSEPADGRAPGESTNPAAGERQQDRGGAASRYHPLRQAVEPGVTYRLSGRSWIDTSAPFLTLASVCEYFSSSDCSGEALDDDTSAVTLPEPSGADGWPSARVALLTTASVGAVSALCGVELTAYAGFFANFDEIFLVRGWIFSDGFESGDVTAWSNAVP